MIGDTLLICPLCCLSFVHLYLFVNVCVFNSFVCIFAHFISCALLVLALALQDIIHSWLQISICIQICIFTPLCVCIFYLASTACIGIIIAKQGCRWEEGGVSIYHRSVEFRKKLRQKRRGGGGLLTLVGRQRYARSSDGKSHWSKVIGLRHQGGSLAYIRAPPSQTLVFKEKSGRQEMGGKKLAQKKANKIGGNPNVCGSTCDGKSHSDQEWSAFQTDKKAHRKHCMDK